MNRARTTLLAVVMLMICSPAALAQSDGGEQSKPIATFFSETGATLSALVSGSTGAGLIVYYLPHRAVTTPSLVVRLSKPGQSLPAQAEVFQAPEGHTYVPVHFSDGTPIIDQKLSAAIVITALEGWWVRNGTVNYNLDIRVNELIHATWGGETLLSTVDQIEGPVVEISVRDPHHEGYPLWDLRQLVPTFPGYGFLRTNYVESKCPAPVEITYGVSPEWPFVAWSGGYEQEMGKFRPPIVVDWSAGKVAYFSEMVTARHQNCSYVLYSLNKLLEDDISRLDFETPFATYDLSGEGIGHPNLILRSGRFLPDGLAGQAAGRNSETIRYSWRGDIGDWRWDYKVEVFGFEPYTFETQIAGGEFIIDAPAYESFPAWVIERAWPIITFVDTEGRSTLSSEGIYAWSPTNEVGWPYLFGWYGAPATEAFKRPPAGYRGEFRDTKEALPPLLYASPIDNRLHLLGAQGGLWQLDANHVLRLHNLGGGMYINGWTMELVVPSGARNDLDEIVQTKVAAGLYAFERHLIYFDQEELTILETEYKPVLFEVLPPSDRSAWRAFNEQVEPVTKLRRNPYDLLSWLDEFVGRRQAISDATVRQIRLIDGGFRLVLSLSDSFRSQETGILDLTEFPPGEYLVQYTGDYEIVPLTPPELSIRLTLPENESNVSMLSGLNLEIHNAGNQDADSLILSAEAVQANKTLIIARQPIQVLPGDSLQVQLGWQPTDTGLWTLSARLIDPSGAILAQAQRDTTVTSGQHQRLRGTVPFGSALPAFFALLAFAGILAWSCRDTNA